MLSARLERLFGRPRDLPPRVAEAIRRQQDESEKLVGWIQLTVVVLLGGLYALSRKTFPPDAVVQPVPWVLAAYFTFTVVRLWLAYRRRLPGWLVALSVAVDMSLLMATIWSFHVQYMQPPSFYLKAPTVLYVFLFIALRALRFEVRYILLAGGMAAVGWLVLVLYVIYSDPRDPMITMDYVAYITSNAILIGAEVDKIVSILLVTAILALAVGRGRQLLISSVAEATAARSLSRFFADAVARQIAGSGGELAAGQGVKRDAAILNVDIRGFTPLALSLSPDALIALLTEYQARLVPVIHRHQGVVDKFQGDGILATFGAVEESPSFAADGMRAVDALIAEADSWNAARRAAGQREIRIGVAVASGEVVFGVIGDSERLEYTVLGTPVNLSAKLESHTKTEGVRALTDAATYRSALAQGYRPPGEREERPGRRVAGVDQPVDIVVMAP